MCRQRPGDSLDRHGQFVPHLGAGQPTQVRFETRPIPRLHGGDDAQELAFAGSHAVLAGPRHAQAATTGIDQHANADAESGEDFRRVVAAGSGKGVGNQRAIAAPGNEMAQRPDQEMFDVTQAGSVAAVLLHPRLHNFRPPG